MPETNDVHTFVHGAEQAEARGDHAGAERLLRRALVLQETALGGQHPEVANTLNNLAIVCEMNGNLSDAEACYRRAYAIAISSFPASDPFVTTSRDNLQQFCTARAIPFSQPPPSLSFASMPVSERSESKAMPPSVRQSKPAAPPPAPKPKASAPPPPPQRAVVPPAPSAALDAFGTEPVAPTPPKAIIVPAATRVPSARKPWGLIVAAVVVVLGIGWFIVGTTSVDDTAARDTAPPAAPASAMPSPEPVAAAPALAEPAREPEAETTPPPAPEPSASTPVEVKPPVTAPTPPRAAAPEPPAPTARVWSMDVLTSELCRSLTTGSDWKCAPATGTLTAGPMVFYTRIASPKDTTIEHRWYREDRLHQRVPLRIRANPSGYRTFSRTAITPERAGTWKVELRTQEGLLLDEKTFVVQ